MRLVYLQELRDYTVEDIKSRVQGQSSVEGMPIDKGFCDRLRDAMNDDFDATVVRGTNGKYTFDYVGLYDYVDEEKTGKNVTFFFLPKFLDWDKIEKRELAGKRDIVLKAIDRYNKEKAPLTDQVEMAERKREGLLELAVRMLRDYLENGVYVIERRELELNGQGEIDWNATIETFQPMIKKGRPYYMEVLTEQAFSDEDHYITRLHKCLVTVWGRKLEELGLASVLRVNVPMLSEAELDHFGDADCQIARIDRELGVQFVTKKRETLLLMKELIQRSTEREKAHTENLSFGMTKAEHLWEAACASVLGSELDEQLSKFGLNADEGKTFKDLMPHVQWTNILSKNQSFESRWRLDFIRTYPPHKAGEKVEKLVILDAKYYMVGWENKDGKWSIYGQPGIGDIAKQMFYQLAVADLREANRDLTFVNAFLFPGDDAEWKDTGNLMPVKSENVGWTREIGAFSNIHLFAVRLPGMRLFELYANGERDVDWFKKISGFGEAEKET